MNGAPHDLVVLGATGDLSARYLLPALAQLDAGGMLPQALRLRGVGQETFSDEQFGAYVSRRLDEHAEVTDAVRDGLVARCGYRRADVTDPDGLRCVLAGMTRPVIYLALPAGLFGPVAAALAAVGPPPGARVVLEKPYGTSRQDAVELAASLDRQLGADAVFRVDHFLAEQTVQNILGLRFANRLFEPLWNAEHVAAVEVVWDETLTLEGRAGYYDRAGALRDVVANHLLQLAALVAMEAPDTLSVEHLHRSKIELLRAVRVPTDVAAHTRRARYTAGRIGSRSVPDYVAEPGVDAANGTETLAEVSLGVDTARWRGVPFRLRSGKALARPHAEITLRFRPAAAGPFTGGPGPSPNALHLDLDPERIRVDLNLNGAGDLLGLEPAELATDLRAADLGPYARVLREILHGRRTLSVHADEAEQSWRIIEPILASWSAGNPPLGEYPAGSQP